MRPMRAFVVAICGLAVGCGFASGQDDVQKPTPEQLKDLTRLGVSEAPAKPAGTIRVATYNLENLFDDKDDPSLTGDNDDNDDRKPDHELDALAQAIKAVDADVLAMEEVESLDALEWFRDGWLQDLGYQYIVSIDAGNDRGIENAVLSRYPLSHAKNWPGRPLGGVHPAESNGWRIREAGTPIVFRRSPLMVDVTVPAGSVEGQAEDYTLTLFVIHHKSGRSLGYWREKEADGLLEIYREIDKVAEGEPGRNVIALGDFNDVVSAAHVQKYLDAGFTDAFAGRTGDEVITHESDRRIDFIMLDPDVMGEVVPGSAFVFGTPVRPKGVNWRDLETFVGYASDHLPVAIDIRPVEASGAKAEPAAAGS